jgi:3-deoxy-7-phosphoheptulonate synthase
MSNSIHNTNIESEAVIASPAALNEMLPLSEKARENVIASRATVSSILTREDKRLMVIVGPCSIHDLDAAKEYAIKLKALQEEVKDTLYLVMRVYFEKPRTTIGWKGLISDPDMDNSLDVDKGLYQSRQFLTWLADLGMPAATEALNPITPQYLADLVSWCAIGARTTESQTHREMSSGLSMAVGFKNGTDGNLEMAINAIKACSSPQSFLGINDHGQISTFKAKGNKAAHVILRGGKTPNYSKEDVASCAQMLRNSNLPERIMVDCSHGNSNKDYRRQSEVVSAIGQQIADGNNTLFGIMIESNLFAGNQSIPDDLSQMQYGVSVTDGCIDWQETESVLRNLRKQISSN